MCCVGKNTYRHLLDWVMGFSVESFCTYGTMIYQIPKSHRVVIKIRSNDPGKAKARDWVLVIRLGIDYILELKIGLSYILVAHFKFISKEARLISRRNFRMRTFFDVCMTYSFFLSLCICITTGAFYVWLFVFLFSISIVSRPSGIFMSRKLFLTGINTNHFLASRTSIYFLSASRLFLSRI